MVALRRLTMGLGVITLMGCSTHYQPRPSARVAVVMEGGNLAYSKNGETIEHGFLGGGLIEAVEDDPEALEAAETYQERMAGGLIAHGIGFLCVIGGTAYAVSADRDSEGHWSTTQSTILFGSLGCWLAGAITGSALILSGQPYHFDAINIYNDNVEGRLRPPPLPVTPPIPPPAPAPAP